MGNAGGHLTQGGHYTGLGNLGFLLQTSFSRGKPNVSEAALLAQRTL
jgi:hypothetical protein